MSRRHRPVTATGTAMGMEMGMEMVTVAEAATAMATGEVVAATPEIALGVVLAMAGVRPD